MLSGQVPFAPSDPLISAEQAKGSTHQQDQQGSQWAQSYTNDHEGFSRLPELARLGMSALLEIGKGNFRTIVASLSPYASGMPGESGWPGRTNGAGLGI
jgi:hypothetical protein